MINAWVVFIIYLLFYWYIASFPKDVQSNPFPNRWNENLEDQISTEPSYTFDIQDDGRFVTSDGRMWKFKIPENYIFEGKKIVPIDECYGKEDGFQFEAKGQRLYDYLQKEEQTINSTTFRTNVDRAVQTEKIFYFECRHNKIDSVQACYPGDVFELDRCVPINPCTNDTEEKVFPDPYNKMFYFQCRNGKADYKQCPPDTIFFIDKCISKNNTGTICENEPDGHIFPINDTSYIQCFQNQANLHTCPEGENFFPYMRRCESNQCVGYPDGYLLAGPTIKRGPLQFSRSYMECKSDRVKNTVHCPGIWDFYSSRGDNLTHLPSVFENDKCTVPSLCENVQPESSDAIVPVHEFSKYADNIPFSAVFDNAVGIRCDQNGQRQRVVLEPGMFISYDFRAKSACDEDDTKQSVVIGDAFDRYYDCTTRSILPCPPNTFFNGEHCTAIMPHAHYFKNVPIFKMDNLSPLNDWMVSTSPPPPPPSVDVDTDDEYISDYDVWSHKDCSKFPFLSRVKFSLFLPGGKSYCKFKGGKITKSRYYNQLRLKFWSQRFADTDSDECYPGMKIRTGHFVADSIFYATCDSTQPFVFCPSASTKGIERTIDGIWACKPHDRVYEAELPADKTEIVTGLERFVPQPDAQYTLDGEPFTYSVKIHPNGIYVLHSKPVTLWSEQPVKLYFKTLMTYPPNIYLENRRWNRSVKIPPVPYHNILYK